MPTKTKPSASVPLRLRIPRTDLRDAGALAKDDGLALAAWVRRLIRTELRRLKTK